MNLPFPEVCDLINGIICIYLLSFATLSTMQSSTRRGDMAVSLWAALLESPSKICNGATRNVIIDSLLSSFLVCGHTQSAHEAIAASLPPSLLVADAVRQSSRVRTHVPLLHFALRDHVYTTKSTKCVAGRGDKLGMGMGWACDDDIFTLSVSGSLPFSLLWQIFN